MQVDVMFARFPYRGSENPDASDWLTETLIKCRFDPRIRNAYSQRFDDTPIPMTRNKAVAVAQAAKVDYLVMIDDDMKPDCEPDGKPFWDSSFEFILKQREPSVVGAPYCGPPPACNVYMFRWANWMNGNMSQDQRLEQYAREEAAQRSGFELVGALPTGLIIFDMRAFDAMRPPYFEYEWTDDTHSQKASTEDVVNTRDLTMAGVKCYCNWDAWAGHWKRYCALKPRPVSIEQIQEKYREAVLAGRSRNERMVMVGEGQPLPRVIRETTTLVEANGAGWELAAS